MLKFKTWGLDPSVVTDGLATDWNGDWLVMRCQSAKTNALIGSLRERDIRAWSPLWVRLRKFPGSSTRMRKVLLPCLPSFVFLAEADSQAAWGAQAVGATPSFSFMKGVGGLFVRIKDRHLEHLRAVADLKPSLVNPLPLPVVGERYRIVSGAFEGLVGTVTGWSGRMALVDLGRENFRDSFSLVKIPPFLLRPVGGQGGHSPLAPEPEESHSGSGV